MDGAVEDVINGHGDNGPVSDMVIGPVGVSLEYDNPLQQANAYMNTGLFPLGVFMPVLPFKQHQHTAGQILLSLSLAQCDRWHDHTVRYWHESPR